MTKQMTNEQSQCNGILYAIHSLDDDKWLANTRAAHPGAAIRDYLSWPSAEQRVYAMPPSL